MAESDKIEKKSRWSVFLSRAITTVVLWLLIALAVYFEKSIIFSSIIIILGVLGIHEFFNMLGIKEAAAFSYVKFMALLLSFFYLVLLTVFYSGSWNIEELALDAIFMALFIISTTTILLFYSVDVPRTKDLFFGSIFGFLYITVLISFLIRILYIESDPVKQNHGAYYIIFLLIVTKFSDMGAYIVGTLIGKNKMIPHISPGKTWEGFLFGCLTFAVGGGAIFFAIFQEKMIRLGWIEVLLLGLILAPLAAIGDLAESILKRSLKTKDSGNALPGIGGVLDLVDSVLFTAPAFYFYLKIVS